MRVHSYGDLRMTVPIGVRSFGDPLVRALIFGCPKRGIGDWRDFLLKFIHLLGKHDSVS